MRQNNLSGCAGWPAADGEIVLTYGGSHTAKRSCEAADLSWHERTEGRSTQHMRDIWRQPYSEKELQGSGFELA